MAKPLVADLILINVPSSSLLIRIISISCFVLGTLIILPLFFLVAGDLLLWTWRQLFGRVSPLHHEPTSKSHPSTPSAYTTAEDAVWGQSPKSQQ
ncbi:hypothetical protein L249_2822 [Ophiocordyceps polyrhachis-furcata BCC 54312]|uniref:Uncharacterized protein n=1 Tax=Ophiocordyceps polyrhachis-furcata BCC 54312 TaxID=1330021 RepID=A0A367LPF5_9HYPO|nr:hypothetical protein L249_2822 [Ophiocordyceps polyrhachis-furcata BCC 54312]